VRAWGVGNRTEAARFAAPSAVEALFGFADPGGPRWDLQGCEGAGGTTHCSYRDPERHMVVLLGIPVANGNTIDGPQEVGSALFQPG
jgi:catechol 2,3-dioxygenase-like lactoylglutathione lyase family enzyme